MYTIRGNHSLSTIDAADDEGIAMDDENAIAIAENVAHDWEETVTVLRPDGSVVCQVLPDAGF